MAIYKGPLRQRRDTETNWKLANPVLQAGQLGVVLSEVEAIKNLPTHFKIGDGVTTWKGVEGGKKLKIFWSIDPLITTRGRDLDNPGGARNKAWNFDGDPNKMFKEIFDPYSPPTIGINMADTEIQETGATLSVTNHPYTISIGNFASILIENGSRRVTRDIAANLVEILPDNAGNDFVFPTTGNFAKTFTANLSTRGEYTIIQAKVKDAFSKDVLSNAEKVIFKDRMGWFIAPESEGDYTAKSDAEIRAKIAAMTTAGNNVNKQITSLADNRITGKVDLKPTGGLNVLYVYHPVDRGKTEFGDTITNNKISNGAVSKDFAYLHGTVNEAYVAANFVGGKNYRITKFVNNFGGDMSIIIL